MSSECKTRGSSSQPLLEMDLINTQLTINTISVGKSTHSIGICSENVSTENVRPLDFHHNQYWKWNSSEVTPSAQANQDMTSNTIGIENGLIEVQ